MKHRFELKLITFLLVITSFSGFSQQELGLHFSQNLIQSTETNPAFINSDKLTIGLPSFYSNYYNSAFSIKDLGAIDNKKLFLNPEKAFSNLKETENWIQGNMNLNSVHIGLRFGDLQFRLFHNANFDVYGKYPKKLLELAWYGNERFVGETIEIAPQIDLFTYHEFGLGFGIQANENFSIGTNLKYLSGLFSVQTKNAQASLFTSDEVYQLGGQTNLLIYSAGLSAFLEDTNDDLIIYENSNNWILNQNTGLAVDLGFQYQINPKWQISGSIVDVGFINWRETARMQYSFGEYDFEGVTIEPFDNEDDYDFGNVMDSVTNLVDFNSGIMQEGYKTALPTRFYLSGIYQIDSTFSLGALAYGQFYRGSFMPAFALNAQKRLGRIFEFGGTVNIHKNYVPNVGLNMTLRLAGIQIYGLTDNVISIFDYTQSRNFNLRIGLNVAIRGKQKEKKDDDENQFAVTEEVEKNEKKPKSEKVKSPKEGKELVTVPKKKEYYRRTDKY